MSDFDAAQLPAVATAERLPSLIDRARTRLAEARTSAEVLEAKHVAEAALHYAKVTGAANEAHADCLRIITRAEIRMAREIDAAQERGEITGHGGDRSNVQTSDFADLGVDRRRVAEWRELRDAGEDAVDEAIETASRSAKESGRTVTKNAMRSVLQKRREKPPVIPPRPDHLNQLSLWLRNGPGIIRQFADHREAMSLAARFGVSLDPEMVRECAEFLAALCAGLEADRAA